MTVSTSWIAVIKSPIENPKPTDIVEERIFMSNSERMCIAFEPKPRQVEAKPK